MSEDVEIRQVVTHRDLHQFVKFPWKVYEDDPNWVPPLISEQMTYLDPEKGTYYHQADIALFLAKKGREVLGTIAAFMDHQKIQRIGRKEAGFGFFEVLPQKEITFKLLDTAIQWVKDKGATSIVGPTNFSDLERPGILINGADCPPAMLEAHTPSYYKDFLEDYGMQKDADMFAWRANRDLIGDKLEKLPPVLKKVAEAAEKTSQLSIRKMNLDRWDEEVALAHYLFNETIGSYDDFLPINEIEFRRMAEEFRPLIDADLAVVAEYDKKPVGFCIAFPDLNQLLRRFNGRISPLDMLRVKKYIREIDTVTFKMAGLLEQYRHRGIDALLYVTVALSAFEKGYEWIDGSVTNEFNPTVNLIAERMGAERYKHYRLYRMDFEKNPEEGQ
jgi:GNAT superfamily N-acetyltransferase